MSGAYNSIMPVRCWDPEEPAKVRHAGASQISRNNAPLQTEKHAPQEIYVLYFIPFWERGTVENTWVRGYVGNDAPASGWCIFMI
jgi:hypothetical protein